MSTYNEQLQQNNAELEEILRTAQSLPDVGEGGDGNETWELLQQLSIPADAEESQDINITFPDGYSTYLLIANLEALSASSGLIVYPYMLTKNADGEDRTYLTAFWDYYPGANACRLTLYFEQEEFDGVMHYRVHGCYGTNAIGKPNNHQDSGWITTENTKKYQFIKWHSVKLNRKIAPLSGYTLLGRR